jgi:hypothetical protein
MKVRHADFASLSKPERPVTHIDQQELARIDVEFQVHTYVSQSQPRLGPENGGNIAKPQTLDASA